MADNTVTLKLSPGPDPEAPLIGCVEGLSIKLSGPYTESEVTVKINQFDDDHPADAPETKATKTIKFNFERSNTKKIKLSHNHYKVTLVSISQKGWEGKEYPCFEFLVEW